MTEIRGQALVEFALLFPVAAFMALGFTEAALLAIEKAAQDRSTSVVAVWAAGHRGESWDAVAAHEVPGCDVIVTEPKTDLVVAEVTCVYQPKITHGLWEGLPISSSESAAAAPSPAPSPAPS